jgi:hypothetical protein
MKLFFAVILNEVKNPRISFLFVIDFLSLLVFTRICFC